MERRQHDRVARPSRRLSDRRTPVAEQRRVLLVGRDEAWRLLTAYVFEEAGYTVYAAADQQQAVAFTARLLPDVVVVATATPDTFEVVMRLSADATTQDIPIVVLTPSLHSVAARRTREAGGVMLLAHKTEVDVLVGEVDTLLATAPRARRSLKRRLLDLQELARFCTEPDHDGQARLRAIIDRLQVAIFAVDAEGHCVAASSGATRLTGYSRQQLVTASAFGADGPGATAHWRRILAAAAQAETTMITTSAGEHLPVHAAVIADVFPGVSVVALATL
jgi:PAS domain S-box-containing protein